MSDETIHVKTEFRIREVRRYIVTRFDHNEPGAQKASRQVGEFDTHDTAYAVGYAMAREEQNRRGYGPGDDRVQFPEPLMPVDYDVARF